MINMLLLWWIIIIVVIIIVLIIIGIYNGLIVLRNRIKNAWSQIDVQLKRRADLIPNLVETVKGYAKHEKKVFTDVTKARSAMMSAKTMPQKAQADNMLTGALKSLFAVAENYPTLRASENFMQLQEEISGTENKLAYSRQHYNDSVLSFNNKLQVWPTNVIGGQWLKFKPAEFFKTEGADRKPVKVKFD
ncbi:MAG: LemA family protein [archaeon]